MVHDKEPVDHVAPIDLGTVITAEIGRSIGIGAGNNGITVDVMMDMAGNGICADETVRMIAGMTDRGDVKMTDLGTIVDMIGMERIGVGRSTEDVSAPLREAGGTSHRGGRASGRSPEGVNAVARETEGTCHDSSTKEAEAEGPRLERVRAATVRAIVIAGRPLLDRRHPVLLDTAADHHPVNAIALPRKTGAAVRRRTERNAPPTMGKGRRKEIPDLHVRKKAAGEESMEKERILNQRGITTRTNRR